MKKWKRKLTRGIVLLLITALMGSYIKSSIFPASAQENDALQEEQADDGSVIEETEIPEEAGDVDAESTAEEEDREPADENPEPDTEEEGKADPSGETPGENIEEEADIALSEDPSKENPEPDTGKGIEADTDPSGQNSEEPDTGKAIEADIVSAREPEEIWVEFTVPFPDADWPGNEEMFCGYVERMFYGGAYGDISLFANLGKDKLTGENLAVYTQLKEYIEEIARGDRAETSGLVINDLSFTWTAEELGIGNVTEITEKEKGEISEKFFGIISTSTIRDYLLMDCPYELYWFDKTVGMSTRYTVSLSGKDYIREVTVSGIQFNFVVAEEYQDSGDICKVNTSKIASINTAVSNAKKIVEENTGKTDYEKLIAYKNAICDLVSYNRDAADGKASYGNPWQLIWVFDQAPGTNVVCEGYSKAFQYLCDLSTFANGTVCYTVAGTMSGGTGAGGHMWNVVTFGGRNYLVDVTNCDSGTIGADDLLFLAGTSGSVSAGYTFHCKGTDVKYTYDSDQKGLFGEGILTLAGENYTPGTLPVQEITLTGSGVTVAYGDPVSDDIIKEHYTATVGGKSVKGTFQWEAPEASYGNAGTKKTWKAVFTPDDTDTYKQVTFDVPVEVIRRAITVQADNLTKKYGEEDPAFTYQVANGNLVNDEELTGVLARVPGEALGPHDIAQGTLTDANNPNYAIAFVKGTLTIEKGTCNNDIFSIFIGPGEVYDDDLNKFFKSVGLSTYTLGEVSVTEEASQILEGAPALNGTRLSLKLKYDLDNVGKEAWLTIPVTGLTNYESFDLRVRIKVSQPAPSIWFADPVVEKTYGDPAFTVKPTNAAGRKVAYSSNNEKVAAVDDNGKVTIQSAGTAEITAVDSGTSVSTSYTLTVSPKKLGWDVSGLTAVDKAGTFGENSKDATLLGELKVSGILTQDAGAVTYDCPAGLLKGAYDAVEAGEREVTLSWADEKKKPALKGEKAKNYVLPEDLPGLTGRINAVTEEEVTGPSDGDIYKLEVETGISQVPEFSVPGLENIKTPADLVQHMKSIVMGGNSKILQKNIAVYDVKLVIMVGQGTWKKVTEDDFPKEGLTITLDYPKGTGRFSHDFVVVHMFTSGEYETPKVEKTDKGLRFTVSGLSPIAIGWVERPAAAGGGGGNAGNTGNTRSTGSTGSTGYAGASEVKASVSSIVQKAPAPETGDNSYAARYLLLLLLSVTGICVIYNKKQKKVSD